MPLCDGGLDHVLGCVRSTRLLDQVLGGGALDLPALAEPALFVPETMTLMKLLEQFKRTHLPVALVVDEFGDTKGLVSLTDVTSSIVGDLPAEPGEEPLIVRRDDGSWLMDGGLDLHTVLRRSTQSRCRRRRGPALPHARRSRDGGFGPSAADGRCLRTTRPPIRSGRYGRESRRPRLGEPRFHGIRIRSGRRPTPSARLSVRTVRVLPRTVSMCPGYGTRGEISECPTHHGTTNRSRSVTCVS